MRATPEPAVSADAPPPRRPSVQRQPSRESDGDGRDVRVPTTASTVLAWAESWIRMSEDEELLSGPLTDDELARRRYGSSARQLRRLRKAVLSGALRHQAARLGVTLPQRFVDVPQVQAIQAQQGDHASTTGA
jgi:hypothetical protein